MMRLRRLIATFVVVAAAGCASARPFDAHFEAGRYAEAMGAFDADTTLHRDERALLRSAIMYAIPMSPYYRPDHARELLGRMLTLHPGGEHAREATRLLLLLEELDRLTLESERHRRRADSLGHRIMRVEQERRSLRESLERERLQVDVLRTLAERLEVDLRRTEYELQTLRNDLQLLKAVDLQRLRAGSTARDNPPPAEPGAPLDTVDRGASGAEHRGRPPPDTTRLRSRSDSTGSPLSRINSSTHPRAPK